MASRLPIGLVIVRLHRRGLPPIGQSEIQTAQLAPLPAIRGERIVGIIRPMFVHYIADEGIVRGRLNTEAPALMDSFAATLILSFIIRRVQRYNIYR